MRPDLLACYHSKDANKVRVDGAHTIAQLEAQMSLLAAKRGPRATLS